MEPQCRLTRDQGVLVVDDHAVVRRGLLAFLETEPDLDVVGDAAGGTEALGQLAPLEAAGGRPTWC